MTDSKTTRYNEAVTPAATPLPEGEQQFFLVPAVALMAAVEILQTLPYKQVQHLIPVLTSCQQVTGTPKPEEK